MNNLSKRDRALIMLGHSHAISELPDSIGVMISRNFTGMLFTERFEKDLPEGLELAMQAMEAREAMYLRDEAKKEAIRNAQNN